MSPGHTPGLLLSAAGTHKGPEQSLPLGDLWPGWEMGHKGGELPAEEAGNPQGQILSTLQGGRGLRTAGGEVVRESFLEEAGTGPQL